MRNINHYILSAFAALALYSCADDVSESDRYIYVGPVEVKRAVLIEDFTGQNCTFCPLATNEINTLTEKYGDSAVIAVAIHGGANGIVADSRYEGLATKLANDEYYTRWGVTDQPMGLVNRVGGLNKWEDWDISVRNELQKESALTLEVRNEYDVENNTIRTSVTISGTDVAVSGKLQLWLIEDNVVSYQRQPNGRPDLAYVHNHVFRDAVNGPWGDDFSIAQEKKVFDYEYKLPDKWNPNNITQAVVTPHNISVVAFVYNDNGVQQVTKAAVIQNQDKRD